MLLENSFPTAKRMSLRRMSIKTDVIPRAAKPGEGPYVRLMSLLP